MTTTDFDEAFDSYFGEEPPPDDGPFEESENPTQVRLAQLRAALVDSAGLDDLPDPVPLIDGILFRDSLSWIYGKPGSGKSFVGIDWAGCIGGGIPWGGREVSAGKVVYLVAEGTSGIRRRVRAWEHNSNVRMDNVLFLPVAVQLLNGVDRSALVALVAELSPALVVIDTQARVTIGANENDNGEMGNVVAAADQIREACGACVLMIHHSGRNGENMRGASAFDGAAMSIVKVVKNDEYVEIHSEKQKDAEDFDTIFLKMRPVLESVVLDNRTVRPGEDDNLTKNDEAILAVMREAFPTSMASRSQIIAATDVPTSSVYRCIGKLERLGLLRQAGTEKQPRWALPGVRGVSPEEDVAS